MSRSEQGDPETGKVYWQLSGRGPATDYAMPAICDSARGSWWEGFQITWTHKNNNSASVAVRPVEAADGPFRGALIEGVTLANFAATTEDMLYKNWQPRDTFSRWQDGTSNQIILGEKHILTGTLLTCDPTSGATIRYDTTWFNAGDVGFMRDGSLAIVRSGDVSGYDGSFGSWHPGVCNFLVGDGSVRAFPTTVKTTVMAALSNVHDGVSVGKPSQDHFPGRSDERAAVHADPPRQVARSFGGTGYGCQNGRSSYVQTNNTNYFSRMKNEENTD